MENRKRIENARGCEGKPFFCGSKFFKVLLTIALLFCTWSAGAEEYVFVYGGNYLGVNAAGTEVQNYASFDPRYCLWTCDGALDGTSRALYISIAGTTRYLNGSTTAGDAPTLSNTAQNVWRADGTRVVYRNGNNNYYLYNRNGWKITNLNNPNFQNRNNDSYYNDYGNWGNNRTDYRATSYSVNVVPHEEQDGLILSLTTANDVTIIENLEGTLSIQTNISGSYIPAYTHYDWDNNQHRHNFYGGQDYGDQTPQVNGGTTFNYEWSRTPSEHSELTAAAIWNSTLRYSSTANSDEVVTVRLTIEDANTPGFRKEATIDVTLKAYYMVAIATLTEGTIEAMPVRGPERTQVQISATPNTGYIFDSWDVTDENGDAIAVTSGTENPTTFLMPASNVLVSATFIEPPIFSIAVNEVEHGSASASESTALAGTTITLTATPAAGYVLGEWLVRRTGGVSVPVNGNTFVMPSGDVTVTPVFERGMYNVNIASNARGTMEATPSAASAGTAIHLVAFPNSGFVLQSWSVTTTSGDAVTVTDGSFEMPGSDVTVDAVFREVTNEGGLAADCGDATQITTLAGLQDMRAGGNYCLMANIDATEWNGAGVSNFTGTFNGNYYEIKGLTHALFNSINGGTVKNVRLKNVNINTTGDAGAIANTATGNSKIYNCGVMYSETPSTIAGSSDAGGIVGEISGATMVVNCFSFADVRGRANAANVGGIVGNATALAAYSNTLPNNSTDGWTFNYTTNNRNGVFQVNTWSTEAGNGGANNGDRSGMTTPFIQYWRNRGTALDPANIRYTLSNMVPGTYNVSLLVRCYNEGGNNYPRYISFFANGNTYSVTDGTQRNGGGSYWVYKTVNQNVTVSSDGVLTIGFDIAAESRCNWISFKNVTITRAASTNTSCRVINCMMYGNITKTTDATKISPVYGGTNIPYATGTTFNYYRYESPYSLAGNIQAYNSSLAAEERYLNRFEFYRNILNSNRELCGWYVGGAVSADNTELIGKWVLDKSVAPYPIIKPWGKYPSVINFDASNSVPLASEVGPNRGGRLGTLTVNISGVGDNAAADAAITRSQLTLNVTDKDYENFNYNYYKVQLPYYNDIGTNNYKNNKVVTGWKITEISDGEEGTFATGVDDGAYNFADRHCTKKDLYSVSGRVFSQGAYFNVPEGVTAITIEPYWANCVYLSDPTYDVSYSNSYAQTNNSTMGTRYNNNEDQLVNGAYQRVYTSITAAVGAVSGGATVYDRAIVLVGNYHDYRGGNNGQTSDLNADYPFTVMSIDLNHDNEPDYTLSYQHSDRQYVAPIRFDFLNFPGIGMLQKHSEAPQMPNQGIFFPRGWFEVTNTCVVRFTEFEYDYDGKTNNTPLILLGGIYEQFTSTQNGNPSHTNYMILGDNVWFKEFENGTHADGGNATPHRPISVTGGEFEKFYLSGTFKPGASQNGGTDNAELYVNGGRFGELAGAGQEKIKGNVTFRIDHADIRDFFGGGINATNPIGGNIAVYIDNSEVEMYCGGPKFGDMVAGKTVTTNANNTVFGQYYGAGYGGTSYYRHRTFNNSYSQTYDWNANDRMGGYTAGAFETNRGIAVLPEYEYFAWAGGGSANNVGRFYINYASFSLATTHNVTSTLTGCTVLNDYYGGGNLGLVDGDVTSTLEDCVVYGNVFGGGFSATIPSVDVYPRGWTTQPSYNGTVGVYNPAEFSAPTTYTWAHRDGAITSANSLNGGKIYTNVNLDNLGAVSGNVVVNVKGNTYVQGKLADDDFTGGVFGGGNESAVEGTTTVNIDTYGDVEHGAMMISNVYGGANKANVNGATTVNVTSGYVGNVFGANNQSGTKGSTIDVEVVKRADSTLWVENVYGGGNVASYTGNPVVNVLNGYVHQSVFGGGLGETAIVTGNPQVTIGDNNANHQVTITGNVFGGGDAANVVGSPVVIVNDCNTIIGTRIVAGDKIDGTVYGGGNAAHVQNGNVSVTINAGKIYRVFAGGNGEVTAANISGDATVLVHGGEIGSLFSGSNSQGSVGGSTSVTVDHANTDCDELIGELYGGGNLAASNGGDVTIRCGAVIGDVYGGANQADINNDIVLLIEGGTINRVFGGNNNSGNINGTITVIVDWDPDCDGKSLNYVYGAGNKAKYIAPVGRTNYPHVVVRNASVTEDVFGGGLGETAKVVGNPHVEVGVATCPTHDNAAHAVTVGGTVYGGGSQAPVQGNPDVLIDATTNNGVAIGKYVFGGGLGATAKISGSTQVRIKGSKASVSKNVYGGGNGGAVTGNTHVVIGE